MPIPAIVSTDYPPCVVQAARDYTIPVRALVAIQRTEGGKTGTISRNANGTYDYGPFQINTGWVRYFEQHFRITASMLTNDYCLSARASAYIIRYEINLAEGDFWEGLGHYHSRTPSHKARYIRQVYRNSFGF